MKKPNNTNPDPFHDPSFLAEISNASTDLGPPAPISSDKVPLCNTVPDSGDLLSTWRGIFLKDRIICYKDWEHRSSVAADRKPHQQNLTRGIYNGYLSRKTASKIRKLLTAWISSVEHYREHRKKRWDRSLAYITFATVTLPEKQVHSDQEVKRRILTPFIKILKEQFNVRYYFWRAEAQINGRIHFHLILDTYIDKNQLQGIWNHCTDHLGYLQRYAERTGSISPPSTHIKKVPAGEKMIGYVLKYVAKSPEIEEEKQEEGSDQEPVRKFYVWKKDENGDLQRYEIRKIEGRLWGCSDELRSLKPYTEDLTEKLYEDLDREVKKGTARAVIEEDYWIFYLDVDEFLRKRRGLFYFGSVEYYLQIFSTLYEDPPPALFNNYNNIETLAA